MGIFDGIIDALGGGITGGGLLTAGTSLVGGLLGKQGQEDTNAAQMRLAQNQMDFQERMSNTAYQRAVTDMKAAGLNPMLAYTQGGASSPGGAMATIGNPTAAGMNSAAQAATVAQASRSTDAEVALKSAQAEAAKASATASIASAGQMDSQRKSLEAQVDAWMKTDALLWEGWTKKEKYIQERRGADVARNMYSLGDIRPEVRKRTMQEYPEIAETVNKAREIGIRADLLGYELPEAMNQARAAKSMPYTAEIGRAGEAAGNVFRGLSVGRYSSAGRAASGFNLRAPK